MSRAVGFLVHQLNSSLTPLTTVLCFCFNPREKHTLIEVSIYVEKDVCA